MNVLVLGSCRHLDDARKSAFAEVCDALGAALARSGESILLCSRSTHTADPYVLKGSKRTKAAKATRVTLYQPAEAEEPEGGGLPEATSPDAKLWKDIPARTCEGGWRILHLYAIRDAHAVVAIGGSMRGTHTAIYSAELLSKPTILLPAFGGAASENWGYFHGRYYSDEEAATLRQFGMEGASDGARSVVDTIQAIVKRHARAKAASLGPARLTLLALCALAVWTYVMFARPQFLPPAGALSLLLVAASVSGSMLRLILRRVGALPIEWSESHATLSIVLGMLIGFGLLLIGGFANLSLNGKMMTVDTYDDATRIGATISLVLFGAALFLEQAWGQLAEKVLRQLKKP